MGYLKWWQIHFFKFFFEKIHEDVDGQGLSCLKSVSGKSLPSFNDRMVPLINRHPPENTPGTFGQILKDVLPNQA